MTKYKIKGLDELQNALLTRTQATGVKQIVKTHTAAMQQEAMANASSTYVKGYSKNNTKKSIGIEIDSDGMTGITGMGMDYDPYLETGTRFMAAEPLLRPVFNKHKQVFIKDIKDVMK